MTKSIDPEWVRSYGDELLRMLDQARIAYLTLTSINLFILIEPSHFCQKIADTVTTIFQNSKVNIFFN